MTRILVRVGIAAAVIVAVSVAGISLFHLGVANPNTWATVAAVLAVLAAVASAWTSQRVVELQEDTLEPNPMPVLDLRSRYGMAQLRVVNRGGSPAYDIRLRWDQPLFDDDGREAVLGADGTIPVLAPSESASISLGVLHAFLARAGNTTRTGQISYSNSSGRRRDKRVVISAEHGRTLIHDAEIPRTLYDLQKIPDALKRIADEIARLSQPPGSSGGRE